MLSVCVHRVSRCLYRLDEDAIEFLDKSICCFSELLRMIKTRMQRHRDKAKVSYNCCERLILVLRTVSVELGKGQYRKCSHTVIVVDTHVHPLSAHP